jgi:transposase
MANHINVAMVNTIITLKRQGWSIRRIARELGIDRSTVRRYLRSQQSDSKSPTNALTGSDDDSSSLTTFGISKPPPNAHIGSSARFDLPVKKPSGKPSQCEPYRKIIEEKVAADLTAQRIYQDLTTDHNYTVSYYSVLRFVNRIKGDESLPFRRMECAAGQEAQIDFGTAAPVIAPDGKRRKAHVFRITLSHSRKSYSETVFRQTTNNFMACLENSFWYFGGVPKTLIVDNLRAAVSNADWYDPDINPKIQSFCQHYNTVMLPAKPYTPRHKGKIERGIGYVKNNALKGRRFNSISDQNVYLLSWEANVADKRIHGTTRKQVCKVFEEIERPALTPLPAGRFPSFEEARRSVHRDGHIEVNKAYYSVPPEYFKREVWARWNGHIVRIFNDQMQQIAIHAQVEPGRFQTASEHIHSRKTSSVERGTTWLLKRVELIGSSAEQWSKAMIKVRGIQGIRVLVGLMSLTHQYPADVIDQACKTALTHEAFRLRNIRQIIKHGGDKQEEFEFMDEHPIIRNLSDYDAIVKASLH